MSSRCEDDRVFWAGDLRPVRRVLTAGGFAKLLETYGMEDGDRMTKKVTFTCRKLENLDNFATVDPAPGTVSLTRLGREAE